MKFSLILFQLIFLTPFGLNHFVSVVCLKVVNDKIGWGNFEWRLKGFTRVIVKEGIKVIKYIFKKGHIKGGRMQV